MTFPALVFAMCAFRAMSEYSPIAWEKYLPAIAQVESRTVEGHTNQWAKSYRGEEFGRGVWMVSSIALEHWRWSHWDHWIVKNKVDDSCLYNVEVNRMVALWYLQWLDYRFRGNPDRLYLVLSAYCYGPGWVDHNGVADDYCGKVISAYRPF